MSQEKAAAIAAEDPKIYKEVREFLKGLNVPGATPVEKLSPADARMVLVNAQKSVSYDYSDIEESERKISQDGVEVNIHIVKPKNAKGDLPVFIFIHGGGWVLGDYPTHKRLVRDLVIESGAAAVFPDYSPSPEAKYPTAINEIYAATKWIAENGKEVGVDGSKLAIAGNSVGGDMTAAITLMAKDKNGPAIKAQLLLWPVTDANFETESYNLFANDRFLSKNMMIWFWDSYTTNPEERKHKYASPLQATLEDLKSLPPALIQTDENDVLRDEGEAYARKLDEAGVPVTMTRYQGLIHDYGMLNPLAHIPAVKVAVLQAAAFLKANLFA